MFDLTTIEGVQAFLAETPFAASNVTRLSGGGANFTYRIHLCEPYPDSDSDPPVHTLVLKHAEPYVASEKHIAFSVERQELETQAFNLVPQLVAPSPVVSLPKLYGEYREQRAILMSDSGVASTTLKALLQTTRLSDQVSRTIGNSLGTFLARLHNSTSNLGSPGSDVIAAFASNVQGRFLAGFFTYGRIIETLSPQDKSPVLLDPPLDISPSQLDTIADLAKSLQDKMMTIDEVLTMGDFWPGNILVSLVPEVHLDVVDWEVTKPGFAGLDVGQFLAELECSRVFYPACRASVDVIMSSFLEAYRNVYLSYDRAEERLKDVAQSAAMQFGVHLIVWTPRNPWGSKEAIRGVAIRGVEYLLRAAEGDDEWLRSSIFGGLFS